MQTATLDTSAIHEVLREASVGHTIIAVGSVLSTMPIAAAAVSAPDARSGLVVVAEEQTAGRGRFGRRWEAPTGQALLMTVALKPPALPERLSRLPMIAAVSVLEAIGACAPELAARTCIKWPNDVLLKTESATPTADAMGKVSGILLESALVGEEPAYALIGMGINVNQDAAALSAMGRDNLPGGVRPTSLCAALGRPVDRATLLQHLCLRLSANLGDVDGATDTWRRHLHTLGQAVSVREVAGEQVVRGVAVDVDADGSLVLELTDGTRRHFAAGDVTLRSAAG